LKTKKRENRENLYCLAQAMLPLAQHQKAEQSIIQQAKLKYTLNLHERACRPA
jgi:hypothetical protein